MSQAALPSRADATAHGPGGDEPIGDGEVVQLHRRRPAVDDHLDT
jgi:hypothetical protein